MSFPHLDPVAIPEGVVHLNVGLLHQRDQVGWDWVAREQGPVPGPQIVYRRPVADRIAGWVAISAVTDRGIRRRSFEALESGAAHANCRIEVLLEFEIGRASCRERV